ncbi:MAG TPA: hypothetical protein VGJ55_14095 [Pyrinomonadaceae bacterium]
MLDPDTVEVPSRALRLISWRLLYFTNDSQENFMRSSTSKPIETAASAYHHGMNVFAPSDHQVKANMRDEAPILAADERG